jgi:hypothetical protein
MNAENPMVPYLVLAVLGLAAVAYRMRRKPMPFRSPLAPSVQQSPAPASPSLCSSLAPAVRSVNEHGQDWAHRVWQEAHDYHVADLTLKARQVIHDAYMAPFRQSPPAPPTDPFVPPAQ